MRKFIFYQPDEPDTTWTPEALQVLIGQEINVLVFRENVGAAKIVAVTPCPGHLAGPGIFIDVEVIE